MAWGKVDIKRREENFSMKKILVLYSRIPYPLIGGDRIRIYNTTKILSRGYKVDLLCINEGKIKNELIEKFRFPEEKISVIPHGVLDYYPALVPRKNDESKTTQEKIILFFGVIKPYKGVDILIRAFAQLPNNLQKKHAY